VQNDTLTYRLKRLYWSIGPEIREWNRSLIFSIPGKIGEFSRRKYAESHFGMCGKNIKLYPYIKIYSPQGLSVGDDVIIADYVQISAGGGVVIGDRVGFGPFVKIWSINHRIDRTDIPIVEQGWETKKVVIEEDVWIGMGAIILPGATIGKGAVISAGALLGQKPIPPYALVAGNPGRVIGYRQAPEATEPKDKE